MKPDLIWTPQASEDLFDIYLTIGLDNTDAAERIYTAIEERTKSLIEHPRLGVRRVDIASSIRMLIEGTYLIFYRTYPDTDDAPIDQIDIIRVVYGNRDLSHLFFEATAKKMR